MLWVLAMTVPLAVAAFKIPAFVDHQAFGAFGTTVAYLYVACGIVPAAGLLMFVTLASRGNERCLEHIRDMLTVKDKANYKTRLYVNAMILSTIILLLAVDAHIPAVLLAVACLASVLVYGHAEKFYDSIKTKARAATRRAGY
jgi:hypothetical protein